LHDGLAAETMTTSTRHMRLPTLLAASTIAAAAFAFAVTATKTAAQVAPPATASVLLVGNNWDGTVDVVDPQTFDRLDRIDVAPEYASCLSGPPPEQGPPCLLNNEFAAEGHPQLVDDMRVSPDGRVLYVSRPSFGDAVAYDLTTPAPGRGQYDSRRQIWRVDVSGFRSDHTALSPDGSELLVSATTANVVDVIDTATGTIVDEIPSGDFPHENDYSDDGQLIFNGSIGRVIAPDDPLLDAGKGNRWFTIADATTHEVEKVIDFHRGVRPFVVLPDNRTMYVQLSFFHGFIEYDLQQERTLRTVNLPLQEAAGMPREDYPLDSAHHGLAMNEDFTKICDAGTVADYVAIIHRRTLKVQRIIEVGDMPYWATSSADGQYCFVANSNSDDVSVLSYDRAREVARFPVGDHPQRMRMASVVLPAPATSP
jgi:DNA-binding beta-propeller fold protein YncE